MIKALSVLAFLAPSVALGYYAENASGAVPLAFQDYQCLALATYHEAKGESVTGKSAIAYVVVNRYYDERYPDDICDVVYQGQHDSNGNPIRNACQFSFYCDGKSDEPIYYDQYAVSLLIAIEVINTYDEANDPTMGATMFHADYVKPYWSDSFERTTKIGNHIFYR